VKNRKETSYDYSLFWKPFFSCQRQANHILETMLPEPFSASVRKIEENILDPMQDNAERLSATILNNSKTFVPWWFEQCAENDGGEIKDNEEQRSAA
jgi:hypothetical protein